jgi:hypothetical protein
MKRFLIVLALAAGIAWAQPQNVWTVTYTDPTGLACQAGQAILYGTTGALFSCQSGVYASAGGGGGGGSAIGSAGAIQAASGVGGGFADSGCTGVTGIETCTGFVATDPSNSGGILLGGKTSGQVAIVAADAAGTAIAYILPSTNGVAGQLFEDSGAVTCAGVTTLPAGFPGVCHQLIWAAGGVPYTGATSDLNMGAHTVTASSYSGILLANLPAPSLIRTCEIVIGDPGAASSALADDNDSPAVCGNLTGATMSISEVKCYADSSTGSPAVLPIITGGAANSILTGAIACGNAAFGSAGTLNGSPTQVDGATIDANISTAGGTAKYIIIRIKRTL